MALSNLLESWDKEDKPESSSFLRRTVGDTAVSVAKGVANTGQAAVGLLDIPTLGYAGKALDYTGYDPTQTNQFLEELYTPEQQAANQEVQSTNGFTETLGAAVANPSTIYHGVVESAPLMLGGQAIAKGVLSKAANLKPFIAGAIGEGTVTAGSQAEQIRQQTPDKVLTLPQVGYAAGSGIVTGGISALSGGLANKFGAGDADTLFLGGQSGTGSVVSRFLKGGLTEGTEEGLQSTQEQMASNLALDKPVMEGVGSAGAQGALLGFAQGGGSAAFGGFGGRNVQPPSQAALNNNATAPTPIPPPTAQPTAQPTPAPIITGPLTNAVAQAPQLGTQPLSLPNLPADEIITFSDGSQARSSEVLQHLTTTGYTPEQAQDVVSNLLTQSKKDPQATAQAQQQAEQQKREQDLNAYLNVLSGNQENQRIAEGLKTQFEQTALPKLQEQQQQEALQREAENQARQAELMQRQAQPMITDNDGRIAKFSDAKSAEQHIKQQGLNDSHVAARVYGDYVIARKDLTPAQRTETLKANGKPQTAQTQNPFLNSLQLEPQVIKQPALGQINDDSAPTKKPSKETFSGKNIGYDESGKSKTSGNTQEQKTSGAYIGNTNKMETQDTRSFPQIGSQKKQTRKPIDHENDNLLTAIRKLGGLNKASFDVNGGDSKFVKQNGVNQLFRNDGGMSIDDMQRALRDEGFLQDDSNDQQLTNLLSEPNVKQRYSNARTNFDAVYTDRLSEPEQPPVIGTQSQDTNTRTNAKTETVFTPTHILSNGWLGKLINDDLNGDYFVTEWGGEIEDNDAKLLPKKEEINAGNDFIKSLKAPIEEQANKAFPDARIPDGMTYDEWVRKQYKETKDRQKRTARQVFFGDDFSPSYADRSSEPEQDANTRTDRTPETGTMAKPSPSVSPTAPTEADAGSVTDTLSTVAPAAQPAKETNTKQIEYFKSKGFTDDEIANIQERQADKAIKDINHWARGRFGKERTKDVDFSYAGDIEKQATQTTQQPTSKTQATQEETKQPSTNKAKPEKQKPKSLQDLIRNQDLPAILNHIIAGKSSFSGIAQVLKNKLPSNLKFQVVPELKAVKDKTRDIPAKFNGTTNTILLNEKYLSSKDKDLMEFVLHELAHAETVFALANDSGAFRSELDSIIKKIESHAVNGNLTAKGINFFKVSRLFDKNGKPIAEELIAYGLTDPRFQVALQDIAYNSSKSLWDKFVDSIAKALGIPVNDANGTALAAVLRLSAEVMNAQQAKQSPSVNDDYDDTIPFSKNQNQAERPYTSKQSLNQSLRKALDGVFGSGWFNRLMATGKFKVVSSEEADRVISGGELFHRAWHGSPHDHNKFDSAKIGTGEGNQAYGYGLYFAGAKDVAEWYRDILGIRKPATYTVSDGRTFLGTDSLSMYVQALIDGKLEGMIDSLEKSMNAAGIKQDDELDFAKTLVGKTAKVTEETATGGKLYEVELAPTEDEYLLWDKKPKAADVKKIIKSLNNSGYDVFSYGNTIRYKRNGGEYSIDLHSGQSLYNGVAEIFEWNEKEASRFLHSIGIRGIKYLDGSSRGKGDGNYNYVIFDDTDIEIVAKYSKNGKVQAFYNPKDDTTYFVHDNIDQRTNLVKLMLHEVGVHALQMGKDSKGFENILNQVGNLAKNSKNPIIKKAVKAAKDAGTKPELMNEEIAGYLVEFHPKLSISQKILAWFRSQLRKLGITKINEKDLVYMASQALRNAPTSLLFDEPTRKSGIRESYAGQKAKNADKSALARAVEMEQQGIDMETIRKDTGWFLGMDDKWRFEINDKDMKVKKDFMSNLSDYDKEMLKQYDWWSPTILLNDLINHEQLKNNYPDIFNHTTVELKPDAKDASFNLSTGIITVPIKVEKNGNILIPTNTLLHEIQHAIQSIEGFARGGNLEMFANESAKQAALAVSWAEELKARKKENPKTDWMAIDNAVYQEYIENDLRELLPDRETRELAREVIANNTLKKELENMSKAYGLDPYKAYQRLAGEIEARDTEARMGMTAEERRNTTPYLSQGIPKEDAIVRFGDGVTMSALSEEQRQYKEVEAKYFNEDGTPKAGAMLAPNGMPTNLNKMQWIQVRTPNFIKWFGDWINDPENASKVVDENGEPLVVYHGTTQDFNKFDITEVGKSTDSGMWGTGFYFTTDTNYASSYAKRGENIGSLMPVFLSIKNPRTIKESSDVPKIETPRATMDDLRNAAKNYSKAFRELLLKNGFDGVIVSYNGDEYVAFEPNQIKSAIGNTGAFSPENDDIRYSVRSTVTDFFTGEETRATTLDDIDTMLSTGRQPRRDTGLQFWKDKLVTTFADATRPFERFISDNLPPELASAILSGSDRALGVKAAFEREAMNLFGRDISSGIREIVKSVKDKPKYKGVSKKELHKTMKDLAGTWLSVRYAPIANQWLMQKDQQRVDDLIAQGAPQKEINKAKADQAKRIKAINDPRIIDITKQPSDAGLAGGYNNATAQHLKDKIEAEIDVRLLEELADHVYDMNEWKLNQDIKNGKISQATADKFPKSRFYVPLTGDPRTDESIEEVFSVGNVNQAKDRTIGGRTTSLAKNGIDASFEQLEKSARYHGWKDFKDAIENAYSQLINDKLALGKTQKEAEQEVWEENQIKRRAEDGFIGENDIVVRKDGKGMIYTINNQAAMEALRSVNNDDLPSILKPIAALTRLQARFVTQLMPLFAPTNMIRDVAERTENIRTRKIQGFNGDMNKVANDAIKNAGRLLMRIKPVMMGVLAENTPLEKLFKVDNNDADVQQLKRFLELGGSSTYGDYLGNDSKKLSEKLKATGTISDNAMEAIHLWNNAFEMISGFSIYQSLIKQGLDEKKAATASLNLMNFRKRGKVMTPIRALYMFAQPIATGGHQLAKTLLTPRGAARLAAYTVASAFLYSLLRSGDDDDELGINKMDEQGNFTLYRNVLIPMGDGKYFKVPVGFGMQQLAWAHGVNLIRMAAGSMTPAETAAESIALWTKAAAPIAPAETAVLKHPLVWATQTFTPQIAKPIVNSALDVNAFGAPLTNAKYEKEDKAQALQGRRDTPAWYKMAAEELAKATGGKVDMYPEQLRELLRGYGAGLGNEMLKWAIENPAKEQRGLKTVSPLIDRFIKQSNDDSLKTRLYYRKRDLMNELEIKQSVGEALTPEEQKLVKLNDELKKMEGIARGKLSAARKAERLKQMAKANNLTKQADNIKQRYMDMALTARA